MPEAIKEIPLHKTTRERYLNYALSVITSRALPDVRDGLKPVQRRILYAMFFNLHLLPDAKFRKSAAVVGEVMAKYHPHGDQSIYDAMVRMSQDFSVRYPLVDGQGNFGSLDGDNAAAMRYTEAKLQHIAIDLLSEIKKNTVDYRPNYDGTLEEPIVLPAQAPNLLINGATGIAVGMATAIPPHNLKEVIGACIALIDQPELSIDELVGHHVRGPDFPTGGEILNDGESLREIYTKGRGPIEMRGTYELEKEGRTRQIAITSIPYGLNKSNLITEIADHVRGGRLPQVTDIRDESTEDVRIVLELRRGANPDAAMTYLYRRTRLQMRFNVNLTALVPTEDATISRPERLDLLRILRAFLDFRFEVTTRRLRFDLEQLERRIHILEGFEIIFNALDEAIALIRKSDGKADARQRLMKRFELDWEQAEAVLETKLYRLAKLEIDAIRAELAEKRAAAAQIRLILNSKTEMWALVRSELKEIREAYGDQRRTLIKGPVEKKSFRDEEYIVREDAFVVVTRRGWFKRQKSYTDLSAIRLPSDDEIGWVVPASSRQSLILFTDRGRAYTIRVAEVPQTTGYGEAIQTRFDFKDGEKVVGVATSDPRVLPRISAARMAAVAEGDPKPPYLVALSRSGKCLRLSLETVMEPSTRAGRLVMRLASRFKGGDRVISVQVSDGEEFVSLVSRQGRALVFSVDEIQVLSGPGKGSIAIKLEANDFVMGFKLVKERMDGVQAQTNRGKTEVVRPNKYKPASRGGKGREIIKKGHIAEVKLDPIEWHFPNEDEPEQAPQDEGNRAFDDALARKNERQERQPTPPIQDIPAEIPETSLAAHSSPEEAPEQEEETPEQEEETPEQEEETPEQKEVTPEQEEETPEPEKVTPEQKDETPEIIAERELDTPLEIMPLRELIASKHTEKPTNSAQTPSSSGASTEPLLVPPVPEPKSIPRPSARSPEEAGQAIDEEERLPRLDRIAKMAAERFNKRKRPKKKKKKREDDPNQGNLF